MGKSAIKTSLKHPLMLPINSHFFSIFLSIIFQFLILVNTDIAQNIEIHSYKLSLETGVILGVSADSIFGGESKVAHSPALYGGMEGPLFINKRLQWFFRLGITRYKVIWEDNLEFSSIALPVHLGISIYPLDLKGSIEPYLVAASGWTIIQGDFDEYPFNILGRIGILISLKSKLNGKGKFLSMIDISFGYRYDNMKSESGPTALPQFLIGLRWRLF